MECLFKFHYQTMFSYKFEHLILNHSRIGAQTFYYMKQIRSPNRTELKRGIAEAFISPEDWKAIKKNRNLTLILSAEKRRLNTYIMLLVSDIVTENLWRISIQLAITCFGVSTNIFCRHLRLKIIVYIFLNVNILKVKKRQIYHFVI